MRRRGVLGLDIGTQAVHVAQLSSSRGQSAVANFGALDLPAGTVRDGEILDVDVASRGVRELLASAGIRATRVVLGVANKRVVVRELELPWLPENERRQALRFQIQDHIPIPVDDAEVDFHVIGERTADDGARMQRVLIVAAHRDMVANTVEVATRAGLDPVAVDLNPLAVLRTMGNFSPEEARSEVLIDIGAGVTNIVVHRHGVPRFVRMLIMGGGDITRAIVHRAGHTHDDAERVKRANGSAKVDLSDVIDPRIDAFVDEVRSSLDFFAEQHGDARLSGVTLTGGGALLPGLNGRLETALQLPVEVGNPFRRWPAKDTVHGEAELARIGPTLTTAIGLALAGDK